MRFRRVCVRDPWVTEPSHVKPIPEAADFLCAHDIFTASGETSEALFMHREGNHWQLWSIGGFEEAEGRYISELPKVTPAELNTWDHLWRGLAQESLDSHSYTQCALFLMTELAQRRSRYGWPGRMLRLGRLEEEEYWEWRRKERHDLKDAKAAAELVRAASRLKLKPRPVTRSERYWTATCPDRDHEMTLDLERAEFACRTCVLSGNINALDAVASMRERYTVEKARKGSLMHVKPIDRDGPA